jgi:hypothetical protein
MPAAQPPTRDDLLAAVERSPSATSAHDRAGWVSLFSADARIEDPVGSSAHVGSRAIERFYDTFIGPRTIVFHRDTDIVVGNTVIRDLELEVVMGGSVRLHNPAYLRYDLEEVGDDLKIARLQAFWELPAMLMQFARCGIGAVPASFALSGALLRNQGPRGAAGFMAGVRTGGRSAKRLVGALLAEAANGDTLAVKRRLAEGARLTRGDGSRLSLSDLVAELDHIRVQKPIAAGRHVVAGVDRDGDRRVVIADLAPGRPQVSGLRLFAD